VPRRTDSEVHCTQIEHPAWACTISILFYYVCVLQGNIRNNSETRESLLTNHVATFIRDAYSLNV